MSSPWFIDANGMNRTGQALNRTISGGMRRQLQQDKWHTSKSEGAQRCIFECILLCSFTIMPIVVCVTHPILNRRMHIHIGGRWADGIVPIRPQLADKWWNVVSHTRMVLLRCIVGVWYVFLVDDDDRPKGDVRFGHQSANTRDAIEYSTGDPANASPSSGIWYYSMI